jgi:hypothetical protein
MLKKLTLFAMVFSLAAPAMAVDLPSVEEVMKKYFEACGGQDKMKAVKNQVIKGTLSLTDMGLDADYADYTAPPNSLNISDFQGMGVVKNGLTNGIEWSINPFQANNANKTERTANIFALVSWDRSDAKHETTGERVAGDHACYEITVTAEGASPSKLLFSKSTGLLVQMEQGTRVSKLGEYKEVNGIKIPHLIEQIESGDEPNITITMASVEFDADIPEGTFDTPGEIKAILAE